jgi:Tfp pilus assembly protein PilZ
MAKHILVICDPSADTRFNLEPILQTLEQYRAFYVDRTSVFGSTLLQEKNFDGCIFDCRHLDKGEVDFIRHLSSVVSDLPILILADQITIYSYNAVDQLENTVTLQKPFDSRIFESLLEKTASGKDFKPKVCPRFITDEEVRTLQMRTGLLIPTRMRNYSSGGAFLEYHGISLEVGDEIQISLKSAQLKNAKGSFQVKAKVVWIREGDHSRSAARGVGVQFISVSSDAV